MKLHEKAIMPKGFKCASKNCGLKDKGNDLSVFYSEVRANAAGIFTKNKFPGCPVILGREIIKNGLLRAIIVNSKVSNVGTGRQGIENARRMAIAVSKEFSVPQNEVIMSSTGVIAKPLPIEQIEKGVKGISKLLNDDPIAGAEGIMTTDTYPKALSVSVDDAVITIIGKGAGMIEPNMATMLVYILTDAEMETPVLDDMLRKAADKSFNMLSVDTDTSTSDTCLIMANGLAGKVDEKRFSETLQFACIEMTKMLARDGEGATKLLLANILGAKTEDEAKFIAKAIINSPLVKTMAYGADPNIGRILMAIGKCTACEIQPEKIEIKVNNKLIYLNEARVDFDEAEVRKLLSGDYVEITANLNVGTGQATAYGCDLTEGYIEENAAYYSS
ncbi:Arginine biosynthesis bifunctional protein [Desulfonema magnum]|uniref:Arginine biosynthesis bifunctional protein ArgJ n=2 Tax=Desulfonema magnum TaxID=45655 RepID=A0A975BIA5_9BACT|nr:Arginine biosynthesis bifunctional protein [Desulfonema magnum]